MKRVLENCALLWNDERGFILSAEIVMIGSLLVIGVVAGLTSVRDNLCLGLSSFSQAIGSFNQSFQVGGVRGHCAWTSGSGFLDRRLINRGAVAVCVGPTAVAGNYFDGGYGAGYVDSYGGGGGGGGGYMGGGMSRPKGPAYVAEFPVAAPVVSAPIVTQPCPTTQVIEQPCAQPAATCCPSGVQIIVNGMPVSVQGQTSNVILPRTAIGRHGHHAQPTLAVPNGTLEFDRPTVRFEQPRGERIELIFNEVGDDDLKDIKSVDDVTCVRIQGSKFTNAGLAHLAALKNLEELHIVGGQISDEGLRPLVGLKHLRLLNVHSPDVSTEAVARVMGQIHGGKKSGKQGK